MYKVCLHFFLLDTMLQSGVFGGSQESMYCLGAALRVARVSGSIFLIYHFLVEMAILHSEVLPLSAARPRARRG